MSQDVNSAVEKAIHLDIRITWMGRRFASHLKGNQNLPHFEAERSHHVYQHSGCRGAVAGTNYGIR